MQAIFESKYGTQHPETILQMPVAIEWNPPQPVTLAWIDEGNQSDGNSVNDSSRIESDPTRKQEPAGSNSPVSPKMSRDEARKRVRMLGHSAKKFLKSKLNVVVCVWEIPG